MFVFERRTHGNASVRGHRSAEARLHPRPRLAPSHAAVAGQGGVANRVFVYRLLEGDPEILKLAAVMPGLTTSHRTRYANEPACEQQPYPDYWSGPIVALTGGTVVVT